jgi:hypothetical protein
MKFTKNTAGLWTIQDEVGGSVPQWQVEHEHNLRHYGGGGCSEFFAEMDTGPFPLSDEELERFNPMRFNPRRPSKEGMEPITCAHCGESCSPKDVPFHDLCKQCGTERFVDPEPEEEDHD